MYVILMTKIIKCSLGNGAQWVMGLRSKPVHLTTVLLCSFFSPQNHTKGDVVKLVYAQTMWKGLEKMPSRKSWRGQVCLICRRIKDKWWLSSNICRHVLRNRICYMRPPLEGSISWLKTWWNGLLVRMGASFFRIFWMITFWDALAGICQGPHNSPSVSILYRSCTMEEDR